MVNANVLARICILLARMTLLSTGFSETVGPRPARMRHRKTREVLPLIAKILAKSILFLCLLEWGGESLAVPRDENSLRGGGIASRRLVSVRPSVRNGGPPFLHFFSQKVTRFWSKLALECAFCFRYISFVSQFVFRCSLLLHGFSTSV